LLFTLPKGKALPEKCRVIGSIVASPAGVVAYHGQRLEPLGWDHFRPA
jgi:hypothetical protein